MDFSYSFKNNDKREIENFAGIEIFSTQDIKGIGGIYKDKYKDFIVKEILNNGKILEVKEDRESAPYLDKRDKFTTFNMIKINKNTFNVLNEITKFLNISQDKIFYSGLKDKCSISVQRVSIRGNYIKEIKKLKIRDIFIRSITPSKKPVMLGSNRGNNFTITIRNIEGQDNLEKKVKEILDILHEKGFPNFFGLQRFGTYRPNSHLIGRNLLMGDYKGAFEEFVTTTYSTENIQLSEIRDKIGKSLDNSVTLKKKYEKFPKSLNYECTLIEHILENPNDFEGAFKRLNPNILNLIINAFQSFVFNKMISLRVKKGISLFEPIKGDTIGILDDINGNITNVNYIYGDSYDKYLREAIKLKRAVIIAPIVGYNSDLNDFPLMKTIFEEIIDKERIDLTIFKSEFLNQFDLKGSYRAITTKPIGLTFVELVDDDVYVGKKKLKIDFSLNKGSYATMLLRELMKCI